MTKDAKPEAEPDQLPSDGSTAFGHDQTVKYEVASDLYNSRRADLAEQLGKERRRPVRDEQAIEKLQEAMLELAAEINKLDVTDEETLDAVISMGR